MAGFISRYFFHMREFSYLFLDPLHIGTILFWFARGVILHPIRTFKSMWRVWTRFYFSGFYAVGSIVADALLAALITGGLLAAKGRDPALVAAEAGKAGFNKAKGWTLYAPNQVIDKGKMVAMTPEKIFDLVAGEPIKIIEDAKKSLQAGARIGTLREFKWYQESFGSV